MANDTATNGPTIFDSFDTESHNFTIQFRNQHPTHEFHYTAKLQEAHKPRPESKGKEIAPVEAEYRNGLAAIAAKYNKAHPDWFFFHMVKVMSLMKPMSRKHDTRPLTVK